MSERYTAGVTEGLGFESEDHVSVGVVGVVHHLVHQHCFDFQVTEVADMFTMSSIIRRSERREGEGG